ncbi:MAG: dTDP-4-dehydrorhamnose reductase family protein [Solirubrobacteraceae bacterium]
MLGHQVVRRFAQDRAVHATVRDPASAARFDLPATLHALDAYRPGDLTTLLDEIRPEVVVNCVGLVKQLEEASKPIPAITVNALFPHVAAEASADAGARFIQISTDCVFSGKLPLGESYTEDSASDAYDLYGRTKLLGEVVDGSALTLRTSIIGWELTRPTGLLGWFATQEHQSVKGFTKAIFSGLTTPALAAVIAEVADEHPELRALYQVSAESIDKFSLLGLIAEKLRLDVTIEPVDNPVINRVLDSTRFRDETGIRIPSWEAMIGELVDARKGSDDQTAR